MKSTNNNPSCMICGKEIHLKTDSYINLIDYKDGKFFGEGFYHNPCYNNALKGSRDKQSDALKTMSFSLMKRVNKLLDKQGVEKDESIYEVV